MKNTDVVESNFVPDKVYANLYMIRVLVLNRV